MIFNRPKPSISLCHTFIMMFVIIAMSVDILAVQNNLYHFEIVDPEFDSIAKSLAVKEFNRNIAPQDRQLTHRLTDIAEGKKNRLLKARAIFWQIRLGQLNAQPDTCITALEKAKSLVPKDNDYDYACIAYQLAGNYDRTGQYYTTYQLLQEAIPIFHKYEDYYFLGNAQLLLGMLYNTIGQQEEAAQEIENAGKSYANAGYPVNRIMFFKAQMEKNPEKAIALYKESLIDGDTDPGMTIQSYLSLFGLFNAINQPDSARHYFDMGWKLYQEKVPDNKPFGSLMALNEASGFIKENKLKEALKCLDKAKELTDDSANEYWLKDIYASYYHVYEKLGDNSKAFEYLKKYKNIFELQFRELKNQEIPKARAREAIARQKAMIAEIEHARQIQHDRMVIIVLVVAALLIAAAGVIIFMCQRMKVKKIENRELRSNLEQEMIITRLNRENFEKDLQKKDCEISSSVLLLSNKNDVLQQISEITKEYADNGKIPKEYVDKINDTVGNSIKNDDGWSRFKLHFDSVHPSFFTKLKELSGDLSENDLRLCAYIHIGMRSKEIAAMLGVSPASINTNRYRLRKKLGLAKADNLEDFIRKI